MVSQDWLKLRGVANLCAQTLQSLLQLELFYSRTSGDHKPRNTIHSNRSFRIARLTLEKYVTGKGSVPTREELRSSLTTNRVMDNHKITSTGDNGCDNAQDCHQNA